MRPRPLIVVSLVIICLPAVIAIVAVSGSPAGSQLPVHWNAAREAARFADAGYALFMPVVLSVGLSALLAVLPGIEPLQDRMSGSAALLDACWTGRAHPSRRSCGTRPAAPNRMLPAYDSGDRLHPSDAGYRAIGEAVDLDLFRR